MRERKIPFKEKWHKEFPDAEIFRGWEGGGAYRGVKNGIYYIIIDEGTMADFLDEDECNYDDLTTLIEFENKDEYEKYVKENLNFGVPIKADNENW